MALQGPARKVLQAMTELTTDSAGYVEDRRIALHASLSIQEVVDCLETLEGKESVQRSLWKDGYSAYFTARGRQELRRSLVVSPDGNGVGGQEAVRVVPKGLLSYDEHDADFFLDLLPGPRRSDGLPEIIHFWKTRTTGRPASPSSSGPSSPACGATSWPGTPRSGCSGSRTSPTSWPSSGRMRWPLTSGWSRHGRKSTRYPIPRSLHGWGRRRPDAVVYDPGRHGMKTPAGRSA